jgi:hypothetical protein
MTHLTQIARRQKRLMLTNVLVTLIGCTGILAVIATAL